MLFPSDPLPVPDQYVRSLASQAQLEPFLKVHSSPRAPWKVSQHCSGDWVVTGLFPLPIPTFFSSHAQVLTSRVLHKTLLHINLHLWGYLWENHKTDQLILTNIYWAYTKFNACLYGFLFYLVSKVGTISNTEFFYGININYTQYSSFVCLFVLMGKLTRISPHETNMLYCDTTWVNVLPFLTGLKIIKILNIIKAHKYNTEHPP